MTKTILAALCLVSCAAAPVAGVVMPSAPPTNAVCAFTYDTGRECCKFGESAQCEVIMCRQVNADSCSPWTQVDRICR